jgi:DNA-binding transcriptional LysR family regulator
MELRHLRYFVAIAEKLSYRKASECLRISTPALSKQIKDLESELEVQLFIRDTGGVRLTEAGLTFLLEARLTLAQSQHAMDLTREAAKGRRGRLTVGYVEPIFMGFMPECLAAFHRRYPGVEVTLVELPLRDQTTAVDSGAIQVGFTIAGSSHHPRGVQHVRISNSPIRVGMGSRHRLARLRRVGLAELVDERMVCLRLKRESVSLHGELMQRIFAARALKLPPIRQIEGTEAFRAELVSGLGVSLVPTVGGLSRSRGTVLKPLKDAGADLSLGLDALWRNVPTSQIAANFIALMREVARGQALLPRGN